MKISDLTPKMGSVEVTAEVAEVGEIRNFNKFGKEGKVATAVIKDDTGKVMLTLWNEQADKVKQGDTVTIKNGYVGEYQGEMQLTTGKFGTLEVIPGAQEIPETPKAKEEKQDKEEKEAKEEVTEEELLDE